MNLYQRYKLTLSLSLLAASGFSTLAQGQDLIYVPLDKPCEIINTRNTTAYSVAISGNTESRDFRAWSDALNNLDSQGGSDCPNPDVARTPLAIAATMTARSRGTFHSRGNLTAYAQGAVEPDFTESLVNFWDENVTNTTVIPLGSDPAKPFKLRARIFTPVPPSPETSTSMEVHVNVSVLGYYYSPLKSKQLKNVIAVEVDNDDGNADFTDPILAMASITDADNDNLYLLDIGPGQYALSKALVMKEYVTIRGAGVKKTILEGTRGLIDDVNRSVVVGANHAALMNLSLLNIAGSGVGEFRTGILNLDVAPVINNVNIELKDQVGDEQHCHGILNGSVVNDPEKVAVPLITHANITVDCNNTAYGIFNIGGIHPVVEHVDIKVTGSGGETDAFHTTGANATLRYSTVDGAKFGVKTILGGKTDISFSTIIGGASKKDTDPKTTEKNTCGFVVGVVDNDDLELSDTCLPPP